MSLAFTKMHGAGNDFVIVDCRAAPLPLDAAAIRRLGDRHFGVGFDQLLSIEPATDGISAWAYGIWNTDGSRSGQCGNGVRCIAAWLGRAGLLGPGATRLQSPSGAVLVELLDDGRVRVDMGEPRFAPKDVPLDERAAIGHSASFASHDQGGGTRDGSGSGPHDPHPTRYLIDVAGQHIEIGAVSMGNPHALIEVDDVATASVGSLGPLVEQAMAFPRGCNVGFAEVRARDAIALRVWERGVGETLACGSGACAAVAVLRQRDRVDADVHVALPGGTLDIHWDGPGHTLWMTGPTAFVFEGTWHD
ncbi:MAG TPA: diaminopimelate epimerase [Dokdonella sp.]|uniref:diaminopimelate epimerase n=1 Tax=Dokdonella sp. TaxID=2291710 RepID=UPI0025BA4E15|nr:diaminopimelate epimerase [Dokdonella sp.]MBX3691353.1 diaminopimelate epimerase [Dokdonella sp.]MCW5567742.1 diaminopimelate epimerase [Dokdonella sp.]HNR90964.1 diaminopimelate epimerase [Dokdonella sp.]